MSPLNNDNFNPYASPYANQNSGGAASSSLDAAMESLAGGMESAPQSAQEAFYNSFSEVLAQSIGYFAVCEFLIGTGGLVEKYGILFAAGTNFVTLYNHDEDSYTTCDLYSLKFVTFYNSRVQPPNFVPRQSGRSPQGGNMPNRYMR